MVPQRRVSLDEPLFIPLHTPNENFAMDEHDDDELPLVHLTRTLRATSSNSSTVFGWSDIPCQGDDPMMQLQCDVNLGLETYRYDSVGVNTFIVAPSPLPPPPPPTPSLRPLPPAPKLCIVAAASAKMTMRSSSPPLRGNTIHTLPPSPRSCLDFDVASSKKTAPITSYKNINRFRTVTFGNIVYVRTHAVTVGDHPCCTGGMALTCDWESIDSTLPLLLMDGDMESNKNMTCDDYWEWRQGEEVSSSSSSNTTIVASDPQPVPSTSRQKSTLSSKQRIMAIHLSYDARRQRLQEVTGRTESQLLWEEYRLATSHTTENTTSTNTSGAAATTTTATCTMQSATV